MRQALAKFDQHIQKGAHRRIAAAAFGPDGGDIVPLHGEPGE